MRACSCQRTIGTRRRVDLEVPLDGWKSSTDQGSRYAWDSAFLMTNKVFNAMLGRNLHDQAYLARTVCLGVCCKCVANLIPPHRGLCASRRLCDQRASRGQERWACARGRGYRVAGGIIIIISAEALGKRGGCGLWQPEWQLPAQRLKVIWITHNRRLVRSSIYFRDLGSETLPRGAIYIELRA